MSKLEKTISREVRTALETMEHTGAIYWFERINSLNVKTAYGGYVRGAKAGTPDYIAVLCTGQILFIECKSDTGKQSEAQIAFEKKCRGWAIYLVARDISEVRTTIESITNFYERKINSIEL